MTTFSIPLGGRERHYAQEQGELHMAGAKERDGVPLNCRTAITGTRWTFAGTGRGICIFCHAKGSEEINAGEARPFSLPPSERGDAASSLPPFLLERRNQYQNAGNFFRTPSILLQYRV
ncbi:MAG: hypothetical protein LBO00_09155 [Zoogloeaceae bacterium]|jgi:hypothetical protein|nr:hypothetical protein [Zoogloeaceae bacterium]